MTSSQADHYVVSLQKYDKHSLAKTMTLKKASASVTSLYPLSTQMTTLGKVSFAQCPSLESAS